MQVKVRLIGSFRTDRFKERINEYPSKTKVREVVEQLLIPAQSLGVVLINGTHAQIDHVLNDGDTLSLLPLLSGG